MTEKEALEVIIDKWLDGLEWGNEEPDKLNLFNNQL